MIQHQIEFLPSAAKDFRQLSELVESKIQRAFELMADDPLAGKPLQGPYQGLRSFRVGDYRIVYRHDRARHVLVIYRLGHRRDIYR